MEEELMHRIVLLAPLCALVACGGSSELRSTGAYTGVDNRSDAKTVVSASGEGSGEASADADAPDAPDAGEVGLACRAGATGEIATDVEDGVLVVTGAAEDCVLTVPDAALTELYVRGDGEVTADDDVVLALSVLDVRGRGDVRLPALESPALELYAGGGGSVAIDALRVDTLDASVSGTGDVVVAGEAASASLSLSGTGDFDGSGLVIGELVIEVTGTGDAVVNVTGTVEADVSGAATLEVSGGAEVSATTSNGGVVVTL
jgi:hypothetical protein